MLIHFVHGEKGGVGKSWFCRLLVEYCTTKIQAKIILVESDSSNPDVGRYYPSIQRKIFFSEDDKRSYDVDQIFKLSEDLPVIVNLPAQVDAPLNNWIERNGLVDADFEELLIYKWFVCTGEPDSIDLFKKSVTALSGKIKHILVKNMGVTGSFEANWKRWEDNADFGEFLESNNVQVMKLEPLHRNDADVIVVSQLSFDEAISKQSKVERLVKRRLRIYRDLVFDAIEAVKLPRSQVLPLGEFGQEQQKELISLIGLEVFDGHTNPDADPNRTESSARTVETEVEAAATEGESPSSNSTSGDSSSSKGSKRSKKDKSDKSNQAISVF
jgi:hypothetical protein